MRKFGGFGFISVIVVVAVCLYFFRGHSSPLNEQNNSSMNTTSDMVSHQQTPPMADASTHVVLPNKLKNVPSGVGRIIANNQNNSIPSRLERIPESLKEKLKFVPSNSDLEQQGWKVVGNIIAIPVDSSSEDVSDSLLKTNHHNLFISDDSFLDTRGKQIVFNSNRDRIGIISGTIIIELLNKNTQNETL